MPTATAPPTDPTWRSWLPEGMDEPPTETLLTRDQLLARLQAVGVPIDGATLRFWETSRITPAPVRRRHAGATRALYPRWALGLLALVRALQAAGLHLDAIADYVRDDAPILIQLADTIDEAVLETPISSEAAFAAAWAGRPRPTPTLSPEQIDRQLVAGDRLLARRAETLALDRLTEPLEPELQTLMRRYVAVCGRPLKGLALVFRPADGSDPTTLWLDPPDAD